MTLSEYIRYLIYLDLKSKEILKLASKQKISVKEVDKITTHLGGVINN